MVIQLAEVAAKACCRGEKKITEGERDPASAGSEAVGNTERKRKRGKRWKTKEWTRVEEKEGAIARKTRRWPDISFQGPWWLGGKPHLGSAVLCNMQVDSLCSQSEK